ncbi:MAG: phosphate starvation-inducible protein PhoH, partial [Clostridia bacterium]|nr:phosphate starvation-inducible protein PhoH [Clostridia bacterium]
MAEAAVDKRRITIPDNYQALIVFGHGEANLRAIEEGLGVRVHSRGNEIALDGPEDRVAQAAEVLARLRELAERGEAVSEQDVAYAVRLARDGRA